METSLPKLERAGGSLVVLIVLLVFAPSLFGNYVWDDTSLIVDNLKVRDPSSLFELVSTPFWAQFLGTDTTISPLYTWLHRPLIKVVYHFGLKLGDDSPFAFHLFLLALHLGCTYLVFDLVRASLGRRDVATTMSALVLAAVFAIHPTRPENVAWISGITDVAMTFFVLLGLRVLRGEASLGRCIGGAFAIALAGWSKETAVLAPALVVAQSLALGDAKKELIRKTVASGLGAAAVVVSFVLVVSSAAERVTLTTEESVIRRVLATMGWFASRVVWPVPATIFPGAFIRGDGGVLPSPTWAVVTGAGVFVAGIGLCVWTVRRQRPPRLLFPLAVFFVPLLPVANVVLRSASALIADRFLYLPLLGPLLLLAAPLARVSAHATQARALSLLVAGLVVLGSASETLSSSARFVDNRALFEHEARVQPDFSEAQQTLILVLRQLRQFSEARGVALAAMERAHRRRDADGEVRFALEYLSASVQLYPELDQERLAHLRGVYAQLAETNSIVIEDASLRFSRELDPTSVEALRSDVILFRIPRAVVHMRTLDLEGAERQLEALVREAPRTPLAWELLAICRARRGNMVGASSALEQGIARLGRHQNLVAARELVQRVEELAARDFEDPAMTAVRDANLQLLLGSPGAARALLLPVVSARPDFLEASVLLAQVEEADGLPERAVLVLEGALRGAPNHPILLGSLAEVRQRMAAAEEAEQAWSADR